MREKVWRRRIERIATGALLAATMSGLSFFPQTNAEGRPAGTSSGDTVAEWRPWTQGSQQEQSGSGSPEAFGTWGGGMHSLDPNQIRKEMKAAGMDVSSPSAARAIKNIAELGIW